MSVKQIPKGKYRHFKGKHYWVSDVVEHSETGELLVIYHALYGEGKGYARPLKMFTERVERNGYKGPRFTLVK